MRQRCVPASVDIAAADGELRCVVGDVTIVAYHFSEPLEMERSYESRRAEFGVSQGAGPGCGIGAPSEGTWSFSANPPQTQGRILCALFQGRAHILATSAADGLLYVISRLDNESQLLWEFWAGDLIIAN